MKKIQFWQQEEEKTGVEDDWSWSDNPNQVLFNHFHKLMPALFATYQLGMKLTGSAAQSQALPGITGWATAAALCSVFSDSEWGLSFPARIVRLKF